MEKFKVGDIVWSETRGKGQIIEIPGYTQFRETAFISAVFYKDGAVIVFTADGRESPDEPVTLYHFEKEETVELDFKPFDKVLVCKRSKWIPAVFSHYVRKNDEYFCDIIGENKLYQIEDVILYENNEHIATTILEEF